MKLAYSGIAALVAGTLAAPSPWCFSRFGTCGKRDTVPTAAIQEREALPEPEPLPWCLRTGENCSKRDALPEPGPEPWCMSRFSTCGRKRDAIEASFSGQPDSNYRGLLKRAAYGFIQGLQSTPALAGRDPSHKAELSNLPGGAAYQVKRSVGELSDLISAASSDPASVSAEHDLSGEFEPDSSTAAKREATPWCNKSASTCGKNKVRSDREHCGGKNEACYKAARTAEAVLLSIGDLAARDVKRQNEDVEEYKAKREILAIQKAARDLLDSLE